MAGHRLCMTAILTLALVAKAAAAENLPCMATPLLFPETTLANLADHYYGDIGYQFAVMLATNARADQGFPFVRNPYMLPHAGSTSTVSAGTPKVCVPQLAEAVRLRNQYETYLKAIQDMALAVPSEISTCIATAAVGQGHLNFSHNGGLAFRLVPPAG